MEIESGCGCGLIWFGCWFRDFCARDLCVGQRKKKGKRIYLNQLLSQSSQNNVESENCESSPSTRELIIEFSSRLKLKFVGVNNHCRGCKLEKSQSVKNQVNAGDQMSFTHSKKENRIFLKLNANQKGQFPL